MTTQLKIIFTVALTVSLVRPVRADEKDHDHDHPATQTRDAHDVDHDHGKGHVDEVKLTTEAIKLAKIRVETVKKQPLTATFIAHARLAFNAEATAHVGTLVAGRVVEVKARVGDAVKQGDELLVLESTELGQAQSEYLRERTALAVAQSAVEPAKQAAERAKKLYEQNQGIALAELQKREAERKVAEGAALSAKGSADAARNRLLLLGMTPEATKKLEEEATLNPKLAIRAPIAGRVIEREVTLGEMVSPEKEKLMVLANIDVLWVLAEVPEARLAQVALGSTARIQVAAIADKTFEGKVTHLAPALNPDTRSARVRIDVANTDAALKPGMFATATLASGSTDGSAVLAVPDEAVQMVEGETSVFVPVEGEENTFAKRPIKVGKPIGGMLPVIDGLKEGEQIVVSGSFILKAELGKGEAGHEH
jgi:cobalt-zinc-cadmium efflux system membrane fusion protein